MGEKLSIDKGTTISISLVIALIGGAFWFAGYSAKTDRNTEDIALLAGMVVKKMDEQNKKFDDQNRINQELNSNVIKLSAQFDSFKQNAGLSIAPVQRQPDIVVVSAPPSQGAVLQPAEPPQQEPEPVQPQPEAPAPEQRLGEMLSDMLNNVLGYARN